MSISNTSENGFGSVSQNAAHESELFKAIAKSQACIEFDIHGLVLNANPIFLALFKYELADVLGKHHSIFCTPGTAESPQYQSFWEKLRNGEYCEGEFLRLDSEKNNVYIQASYNPVFDDAGKLVSIIKIASDITGAKKLSLEHQGRVDAISKTQAVIEFSLTGHVLAANPVFLDAMGYRLQEIVGQHHRMFCDKSYVETEAYAEFWQTLKNGEFKSGEFMRIDRNGKTVWLQATYTPILGVDGVPCKIVKFATNITSTKNKAIEDDGKVNAIDRSQGVIEFDLSGNILSANDNFLKLMGYRLNEIVGQHHSLFVDPEEAGSQNYKNFWKKLGQGQFDTGEYLRFGKNDKRVWIQASYNPILDPEGKPLKIIKFACDVTANKLHTIETSARVNAMSASNCVMELDSHCNIVHCNDLLLKSLGYTQQELIGKPVMHVMLDDGAKTPYQSDIWGSLRDNKSFNGELRLKNDKGEELWMSGTVSPVMGLDGKLLKSVCMFQDITQQKAARLDAEGKLEAIRRAQAVIEFDMSGKVLEANPNFLNLLGYTLEEIRGRHHRMFVDSEYGSSSDYQAFW